MPEATTGISRRQTAGSARPRARRLPGRGAGGSPGYPSGWSSGVGAGAAQVLAGLDDTRGHVLLGHLAPGARVVLLLVADLTVDLQHAVVVDEHVAGNRAGEGVLGIGVDVHLDDAV